MSSALRLHAGRPARVLVVAAHPDDADVAMAGTVARWTDEGSEANLVCCTSGDAGGEDATLDPLVLARRREAEQRSAADMVGYAGVTFLHRPDGALANDLALREQLVRLLRQLRPDAVAAPDPRVFLHGSLIQHVDHREAGAAALDAVYPAARNPMAFPHLVTTEGLQPHAVGRLYLYWSEHPDEVVDISATLERKLGALRAHVSQFPSGSHIESRARERARAVGSEVHVAAGEPFAVIDLAD
jgi:LmbE family N-acetylglucosaminyl deacetylase